MENKIKKIEVEGEQIFVKKNSLFGWKVVSPIKNEDGTMNWFNFLTGGSWWNLLFAAIIVIVICGFLFEYVGTINRFMTCFENSFTLNNCVKAYGQNFTQIIIP